MNSWGYFWLGGSCGILCCAVTELLTRAFFSWLERRRKCHEEEK